MKRDGWHDENNVSVSLHRGTIELRRRPAGGYGRRVSAPLPPPGFISEGLIFGSVCSLRKLQISVSRCGTFAGAQKAESFSLCLGIFGKGMGLLLTVLFLFPFRFIEVY